MSLRAVVLLSLCLLLCSFPRKAKAIDAPEFPDAAPTPVPGSLVPPVGPGVRVLSHRGEWTSFFTMNGGSEEIFLISGRLENTTDQPLTYVKLQFELLGEDQVVILRDYGYNRKAEALREEAYETGKKSLADMGIEQVAGKAQEDFRFIFFKGDVPEFHSYRIRVLESR